MQMVDSAVCIWHTNDMKNIGRKVNALELAYARALMANNEIAAQQIKNELEALLNQTQMPEVVA